MRKFVDQSSTRSAGVASISQNVLPSPKFISSAKAVEYRPPSFQGKVLTGLGAFTLTTLKAAASCAVQMDEKGSYTKAYKYYEIAVSMICIMLWHKSAWSASMGTSGLTDKVRRGWYNRVVMYRTRQAQMLSSITKVNISQSDQGKETKHESERELEGAEVSTSTPTIATATDSDSDKKRRTPTLQSTSEELQKMSNIDIPVPDNLRSFIEIPEEEEESLIEAFSELRPAQQQQQIASSSSTYPRLPPSRINSEVSTDLPSSPRQSYNSSSSSNNNNDNDNNNKSSASLMMQRIQIVKPRIVAMGASRLTIEWSTIVTSGAETKQSAADVSENAISGALRTASSTTEEHGSRPSTSSSSSSTTNDINQGRRRSFTTPAILQEVSIDNRSSASVSWRSAPRRSVPVFQVGWCVDGGPWVIEPTLVVAAGITTRGRYTKENFGQAGKYQFRIRIHRPTGTESLPWSEISEPVLIGNYPKRGTALSSLHEVNELAKESNRKNVNDKKDFTDEEDDNTKMYHALGDSNENDQSDRDGNHNRQNVAATLRAPSVDDDGNLLELIDPEEIVFDKPPVILGQGGFGIVSRSAVNGFHGMTVAIKRVKPRAQNSSGLRNASDSERAAIRDEMLEAMVSELHAESSILAKLSHRSIVSVLAINLCKESPFLVMEYCDAGTLKDLLHPRRRSSRSDKKAPAAAAAGTTPVIGCELNLRHRLILAEQVISAVAYLHARYVVHRDLKPANVLLKSVPGDHPNDEPKFVAKLTDFGLSRTRSRTGAGLDTVLGGSYPFLAPEAFRSTPITQSVDVYSFGIMLHEIVSLEKPWSGYEPFQITVAVAVEGKRPRIPTTKTVPKSVWTLVRSCWSQEPNSRPEALEVCITLRSVLNKSEAESTGRTE
jgi:tRNA A-37 threonylcarbamoyl transferase component Bud32